MLNADQLIVQDEFTQEKIEIPEEIFYTIEEGDTLWAIAKKFYGDGSQIIDILGKNCLNFRKGSFNKAWHTFIIWPGPGPIWEFPGIWAKLAWV